MVRVPLSLTLLVAITSCTDAFIEPKAIDAVNIDDRLALKGRVCSSLPDPTGFPVKVVLIVDQSGSMCVSDPPGSQPGGTFCADALAPIAATLPPQPARVKALEKLFQQFKTEPNVSVAIVPFETNVKGVWPVVTGVGQSRFAQLTGSGYDDAVTRVGMLQSELGKGTDYQGALSYAYGLISSDIVDTETHNPEVLPRTRYVVVFLTDGTPFPRCSANDSLSMYADNVHPELTWADSSGAGCSPTDPTLPGCFCNVVDPMSKDAITGFVMGTDRNQNYQLFSYVDQLMELKSQHNIGDIRLHTVLVFNKEAVTNCGPMCEDLYGTYPGVLPANYTDAAYEIATWLLQQMANRGNGIYQEFKDEAGIASLSLGALDYSSLASRNVMKTLLVRSMSATPPVDRTCPAVSMAASQATGTDRAVDEDGDGLPDDLDNGMDCPGTWTMSSLALDSDGDCFDDNFEVQHYSDGFRPDVKDGRGCDPMSPLTPGCSCSDIDGDGLSQFAESYLKTRETIMDSDGDGIPDGEEVRYGLDALSTAAAGLDTDGDGNPDGLEFRADSNPIKRDTQFFAKNGYEYEITPDEQSDGTVCYDFTVSNLQLVSPTGGAGLRKGFNVFKVYFAEAPESGVATDYGVWRTACAWAQYAPPSVRDPAGPELNIQPNNFTTNPSDMTGDPLTYKTLCVGNAP